MCKFSLLTSSTPSSRTSTNWRPSVMGRDRTIIGFEIISLKGANLPWKQRTCQMQRGSARHRGCRRNPTMCIPCSVHETRQEWPRKLVRGYKRNNSLFLIIIIILSLSPPLAPPSLYLSPTFPSSSPSLPPPHACCTHIYPSLTLQSVTGIPMKK